MGLTEIERRARMVSDQLAKRGIGDEGVLAAMRAVPRHEFVPDHLRARAYEDTPLSIGEGQTISQPFIVAKMTELAGLTEGARVLEIGTGCGYQTAVLSQLGARVFSIEVVPSLASRATDSLARLGYAAQVRAGDGYQGWSSESPFDAIVVCAAAAHIPVALKQQLKVGGRLVVPVGKRFQDLMVVTRNADGFAERVVFAVRFVPMIGKAQL